MKILVTGFEPFGSDSYNPSKEVLRGLSEQFSDAEIITAVLPVVRFESLRLISQLIEKEQPDAVLSLGLAGGRNALTPERTAVNIDDFRIPDNGGNTPHDEKIFADGPDAYFSSLPYRAMIDAIRKAGIPAALSESAGTFVCNHVFYGTRYLCERNHPAILCGFMHVPYAEEMHIAGKFSLPLPVIQAGVAAALRALIEALS